MGFPVAIVSTIYNAGKDLWLWYRAEEEDVKDLHDRLTELITDMISINSRKEKVDETMQEGTKKKSLEYEILERNIQSIFRKFNKFMVKSSKMRSNLPSPPTEQDKLDVSTAKAMTDQLQKTEPKKTRSFLKLAKLSRDIEKLNKRTSKVLDRLEKKGTLMVDKKFEEVVAHGGLLPLHDENEFPGVSKYVNDALELLKSKKRIGIRGIVGVGKTTVMEKLYRQLIHNMSLSDENNIGISLDRVLLITYRRDLRVKEEIFAKMQDDIMLQLKITKEENQPPLYHQSKISAFLSEKKYVALIDDVMEEIDLDKLGLQKSHEYGKVVIASHNHKIIQRMTEKHVEIQKLSIDNARKLFEHICGEIHRGRIREIAAAIIKSCEGLPGQIKLVAKFLEGKQDEGSWKDVKRILHSDTESIELLGLGGICGAYRMVYGSLKANYIKKCSLYGALFPAHHKIHKDYLTECWMAEHFIGINGHQRLRHTKDRGRTVLNELTEKCLLEYCSDNKCVKMPLNFRKVALELKYPDEENCVIWEPMSNIDLDENIWETATRMSLIGWESELPKSPKCSNIRTLLLQSMRELENLEDNFFSNMQKLRVLDLRQTKIKTLPGSIKKLVELRSLFLNDCRELATLPPELAELKRLELLDICGTALPSLPGQIRSMEELRCLRASFSHNSEGEQAQVIIIPEDIIRNLKRLEELSIDIQCHIDNADQLAAEIASLKYLTTLCFNFPTMSSFQRFVTDRESLKNTRTNREEYTFRSFVISIGRPHMEHPYGLNISGMLDERRLRFSTDEEICSATEVLKQASTLELIGNHQVKKLSTVCSLDELEVCVVGNCNGVKNIVDISTIDDDMGERAHGVLKSLERLHLYDLKILECIWEGSILQESFSRLTVLTLHGCPELKRIFNPALARAFRSLKLLKVEKCRKVMEIVGSTSNTGHESRTSEIVQFPQGSTIVGSTSGAGHESPISEIVEFSQGSTIVGSTSSTWHGSCISEIVAFPKGSTIVGSTSSIGHERRISKIVGSTSSAGHESHMSEIVGSTSSARHESHVSEIVEFHQGSTSNPEQENPSGILNNMGRIELSDLPKLQSICTGDNSIMGWDSLTTMVIRNCKNLTNLSLTKSSAEKLESFVCGPSWWFQLTLANEVKEELEIKCRFVEEPESESKSESDSESESESESESTTNEGSVGQQDPVREDDGEIMSSINAEEVSIDRPAISETNAEEETPIHGTYSSSTPQGDQIPTTERDDNGRSTQEQHRRKCREEKRLQEKIEDGQQLGKALDGELGNKDEGRRTGREKRGKLFKWFPSN